MVEKVSVEINQSLYEQFLALIQEKYLSDDVSEYLEQLIELELQRHCAKDHNYDNLTKCKTRHQLERDIAGNTFGKGWSDHTLFKQDFICFDIANFKGYVDVHGLEKADETLTKIAQELKNKLGASNVYRFGPDEFVVQISGSMQRYVFNLPPEIILKHTVVHIEAERNQRNSQFVNRTIMFNLDKGVAEATEEGHSISCQI